MRVCGKLRARFRHQLLVQRSAPVDHGEERQHREVVPALAREELAQLPEHAHREGRWHQRHDHGVGGAQHVLGEQRDPRRAVEEQRVIDLAQRPAHAQQPFGRVAALGQMHGEVAVGEVRRQQVESRVAGGKHQLRELALAGEQLLRRGVLVRLAPQSIGSRALRIEVPEQRRTPGECAQVGEIHRGGGLADPTLDVGDRDDPHACRFRRSSPACAASCRCRRDAPLRRRSGCARTLPA